VTRAVFVVNPASDGGATGRGWPQVAREARARGLEVDARLTEGPGHATEIARAAAAAGTELVVSVGGDGTLNEVANGIADGDGPAGQRPRLGVIERGTGCDFVRTYEIPKRPAKALDVIVAGRERTIDVGRASFTGADGSTISRLFCNVGSCGLTGDVARRANASAKRLGGTPAFLWATARAFASWHNVEFSIRLDGDERRVVANNVICANGRWFGGGMKIAPDAEPDDGLFDVLVIGDVGKLDLALNLHRLYGGTLARHPKVDALRAAAVEVTPAQALPIEVDGEVPGTTPARFDIVPDALRLIVP
jgi:YegS/Rv2252/BmrU family lipid kinase